MMLTKDKIESIRNKDFKIHCHKIKVWQENGISMEGYGSININKRGALYVEFICTENNINITSHNFKDLNPRLPLDLYNDDEKLFAELTSIDGDIYKSEGFTIKIFLLHIHTNQIVTFFLSYITNEQYNKHETEKKFMHYEFFETVDIHTNVMNKITSTQGESSMSWNETKIETENFIARIINEKTYTAIKVSGDFNKHEVMESINYYIAFSCGVLPQPYLIINHSENEKTIRIVSVNNEHSRKRSSNPIPSSVIVNKKASGDHCFNLFKKILELRLNDQIKFNSLRAQWERVWQGFTSSQEICELVLSVAVEGLLNDIYIPIFNETRKDEVLIERIDFIKKEIEKIDLSQSDMNRLKSSVSYWKHITAAKALDILIDEEIINENDKKIWQKIRNDAAHPKVKERDNELMKIKMAELIKCVDIFHKLSLNVIGYTGPLIVFSDYNQSPIYISYKNVLSNH